MDEYTLYLDESRNDEGTYFAVSGIIIKNTDINILNAGILEAKHCIWDYEYIEKFVPILHCVELTTVKKCCWNSKYLSSYIHHHPQYLHLQDRSVSDINSIYNNVYSKLCKLLKDINGIVIGCSIDISRFKYLYGEDFKINSELFFEVAMQETIENYAHFLYKNNGIGCVVYESRNDENAKTSRAPDFKMYNNFCQIKSSNKGISFIDQSMMAKTIRYLNIFSKRDDIAGLQLADFIAYNTTLVKTFFNDNNKTEFQNKIIERLYNGNFKIVEKDLRSYFGMKYLPYDFEQLTKLEKERLQLKRSLDSIKIEKNGLMKKNKQLYSTKNRLVEENKKLKEQIKKVTEIRRNSCE